VIIMAVSLPTAADVRKVREQAAKGAAERAEAARTPLLAVLGAGDLAVAAVTKAVGDARSQRLSSDELRKAVADFRVQAGKAYAGFAERGEEAWGRLRQQPQVQRVIATIEAYTEKLDARVDGIVDDAHDAAERALGAVTTQTRSTGELVARATQRFTGQAAATVIEATDDAAKIVADTGAEVAADITEAGAAAAAETRSAGRRAADRTAPKTAPKAAAPKPGTTRTNGSSSTR
jgi:heparin binding hemagglutinin HbhA